MVKVRGVVLTREKGKTKLVLLTKNRYNRCRRVCVKSHTHTQVMTGNQSIEECVDQITVWFGARWNATLLVNRQTRSRTRHFLVVTRFKWQVDSNKMATKMVERILNLNGRRRTGNVDLWSVGGDLFINKKCKIDVMKDRPVCGPTSTRWREKIDRSIDGFLRQNKNKTATKCARELDARLWAIFTNRGKSWK